MRETFDYHQAFDRNIGWLTQSEQTSLKSKTVAIAGMGGVGGVHLLTLARLGIGKFHLADLDKFELANFNRQVGATMSSLDREKVVVLAEMAADINPQMAIKQFTSGVTEENLDEFLDGVDLFIDGFDFFALDIRRKTFARCWEKGVPAVTAAPIGMGVAFLAFFRGGMSFEEYFRLEGQNEIRGYVNFLVGLAPSGMHSEYLVDPTRLDIVRRKTPSTIVGVQLCASYTGAQALKLLIGRGDVRPAPFHYHFDAYLNRFEASSLEGNNSASQIQKGDSIESIFRERLQAAGQKV